MAEMRALSILLDVLRIVMRDQCLQTRSVAHLILHLHFLLFLPVVILCIEQVRCAPSFQMMMDLSLKLNSTIRKSSIEIFFCSITNFAFLFLFLFFSCFYYYTRTYLWMGLSFKGHSLSLDFLHKYVYFLFVCAKILFFRSEFNHRYQIGNIKPPVLPNNTHFSPDPKNAEISSKLWNASSLEVCVFCVCFIHTISKLYPNSISTEFVRRSIAEIFLIQLFFFVNLWIWRSFFEFIFLLVALQSDRNVALHPQFAVRTVGLYSSHEPQPSRPPSSNRNRFARLAPPTPSKPENDIVKSPSDISSVRSSAPPQYSIPTGINSVPSSLYDLGELRHLSIHREVRKNRNSLINRVFIL